MFQLKKKEFLRVYDIHEDVNPHTMGSINKLLEFFRCSEPRGDCERAGDVITEGAIVSMLCDCHDLNGIVSKTLDSRENIIGKLIKCMNTRIYSGHSNVRFVNLKSMMLLGTHVLELVLGFWPPELGVIEFGIVILDHPAAPDWNTICPFILSCQNVCFYAGSMWNDWITIVIKG